MIRKLTLLFVVLVAVLPSVARAHEVRPAYLEITETLTGRADVLWKQPAGIAMAGKFAPRISPGLLDRAPDDVRSANAFEVRQWRNLDLGTEGLNGRKVSIDGLDGTITDTLLVVRFRDGSAVQQILTPARPSFTISARKGTAVLAYLWLGIRHILTGPDHLLFVLGLMLLSRNLRLLIETITAFTVAHSITLVATALHWMHPNPSLVEALVALSIVFLAVELVRSHRGEAGLAAVFPWLVSGAFGLLHGTAFAGALQQIGLPEHGLLLSLFLFNVGVELGQISFVAAVGTVWLLFDHFRRAPLPGWAPLVPAYAIGALSMFWFLERVQAALVQPF